MPDIRRLTERFSVSPQLQPADFAELKAQGIETVINNRPDGEESGQPTAAQNEAAAKAAGIAYVHAPFSGQPTPESVAAIRKALEGTSGKVLAHCRSGTRSSHAWAMAAALTHWKNPDEIIEIGKQAGYNLAPMKDLLRNLARQ